MAASDALAATGREVGAPRKGHTGNPRIGEVEIRMEKICEVLEQFLTAGTLKNCAIGGATAAGFHGRPLATLDVVDVFAFIESNPASAIGSLAPVYAEPARVGFGEFDKECILVHGLPVPYPMPSRMKPCAMRSMSGGTAGGCALCAPNISRPWP